MQVKNNLRCLRQISCPVMEIPGHQTASPKTEFFCSVAPNRNCICICQFVSLKQADFNYGCVIGILFCADKNYLKVLVLFHCVLQFYCC